jgi:hypothetical protein
MRKRSKYRPKHVLQNPLGYVLESLTPVSQHDSFLIDVKIKAHMALVNLTQGKAVREDIDMLIQSVNVAEALYRMGFGTEYGDVMRNGLDALHSVGVRGAKSNRFILKSEEMTALNTIMELHDAQLEVITLKDMERAYKLVVEEFRQRKMRPIVTREEMT